MEIFDFTLLATVSILVRHAVLQSESIPNWFETTSEARVLASTSSRHIEHNVHASSLFLIYISVRLV